MSYCRCCVFQASSCVPRLFVLMFASAGVKGNVVCPGALSADGFILLGGLWIIRSVISYQPGTARYIIISRTMVLFAIIVTS